MLYLEDYLELIEQLPQDLRDRFTDMRELDLKVQNAIDTMDSKVERFFKEAKDSKPDVRKQEYHKIKESYGKVIEDADEKVTMASQIFDLVDRHLRKLDQELSKFKMELEADCAGITEVLEKRSMMYDETPTADNFNYSSPYQNIDHHEKKKHHHEIDRFAALNGFATSREASVASPMQPPYSSLPASPQTALPDYPSSSGSLSYTLGHVGAGSAAIAAAAAQAVTSTMQQHQGRRGAQASFKASVATAMKAEQLSNSLQSLLGTVPASLPRSQSYVDVISTNRYQSTSSISPKTASDVTVTSQPQSQKSRKRNHRTVTTAPVATSLAPVADEPAMGSSLDWVPEPNEPTYCLCNQVSYGEMVGCDNPDCSIEWFHYGCVGLAEAPEGKWYCPRCTLRMKKRKAR